MTFDAIVEAGIQVLLRRGYRAFTTARVAEVAGVSVGSLYQYFPNKQSLIREIVRRLIDDVASAVCQALAREPHAPAIAATLVGSFLQAKRSRRELSASLRDPLREFDKQDLIEAGCARVAAALQPALRLLHPELPAPRLSYMGALLVAAIEGPVMRAVESAPDLLEDPEFEAELVALADGYLARGSVAGRDVRT